MADFAPELPNKEPNEYLKYSSGYRDEGIGELFKGLGDAVSSVVKFKDEGYKRLIKDDLRASVDDIQNATIDELQAATGNPNPRLRTDRTPDEIQRFNLRMQRMQAGVRAGNIKDSSYYGMLDATARQLRARFPGYRDYIDGTMQEFTGTIPANALIRSLRSEAEQMQRGKGDTEAQKIAALVEWGSKKGIMGGYDMSKLSYPGLLNHINREMAPEHYLGRKKAEIDYARQSQTYKTEQGEEYASIDFGLKFKKLVESTSGPGTTGAMSMDDILAKKNEISLRLEKDKRPATAEEIAQLQGAVTRKVQEIDTWFNSYMNSPDETLGNKAPGAALSKAKIDQIRGLKDGVVELLKKSVYDKDLGAIAQAKGMLEITTDERARLVLSDPDIARWSTLNKVLGSDVAGTLLLRGGSSTLPALNRAVTDLSILDMVEKSNSTSLGSQLTKIRTQGFKDVDTAKALIDKTIEAIKHKAISPEAVKGLISSVYGPNNRTFLNMVSTKSDIMAKHKIFQQFTSPEMTARVKEISTQLGDPSVWGLYKSWTLDQTESLNMLDINTIAEAQQYRRYLDVRYDPDTMSFTLQPKAPDGRPDSLTNRILEPLRTSGVQGAIDRLNVSLQPVRDLAKADKKDPNAVASELMERLRRRSVLHRSNPDAKTGADMVYEWLGSYIPGNKEVVDKLRVPRGAQ